MMSRNVEFEKRVMLTKEEYDRLLAYALTFKNREELILVNHYFDDEDLSLRNHHYMLRIRSINGSQYEVTLKTKRDNGDLEINEPVSIEEVYRLLKDFDYKSEEITPHLEKVTNKKLKCLASLKTERIEIPFRGYLFVLDKNYYSDIVDYDLEIEGKNIRKSKKVIKKYCTIFGMQFDENYKSKSKRAINRALER